MSVLHLLEGPAAKALLKNAQQYTYVINKPVVVIAVSFTSFCLAIAGFLYFKTALDEIQMVVALVAALLGAAYFSLRVLYWSSFVSERVIALTDNVFIVGTKEKVWAIDWSILTSETMGIEDMVLSKMGAHFLINVAGEEIKVPLYGAMFYLEELEKMMGDILARMTVDEGDIDDDDIGEL